MVLHSVQKYKPCLRKAHNPSQDLPNTFHREITSSHSNGIFEVLLTFGLDVIYSKSQNQRMVWVGRNLKNII